MTRSISCSVVALGLALAATSCSRPAALRPAQGAKDAPGANAAQARDNNIRVVVDSDSWQGRRDVKRHVTPLWVRIENNGDAPVRVRLRDIALVGGAGRQFDALPMYAIDGSVDAPVLIRYDPIHKPSFTARGYMIAGIYGPVYPDLASYPGVFDYDFHYHDTRYRYWAKIPLPTTRMRLLALPEGVLKPGGTVEGFIFFEKVDPDVRGYRFEAELVNAESRSTVAELSIPFKNIRVSRR